jgi:glycosyltransferase involved in cell wall biosynthesis
VPRSVRLNPLGSTGRFRWTGSAGDPGGGHRKRRRRRTRVALVALIAGGHSGVPRYAVALARALDRVSEEFPELRLELVSTREGAAAVGAQRIAVRDLGLRGPALNAGPGRIAAEQIVAASIRADLLHFFDLTGPLLAPWRPFVTTIHDASVVHGLRGAQSVYKRRLWPWAARAARTVVAISHFAKVEAIRHLDAPAGNVEVIHSGPGFIDAAGDSAVDGAARNGFLLYVGNLTPIKNLPFLVRAFDRADVPARLILVGQAYQGDSELPRAIERARRREQIEVVSDAGDAEIDALYRSATALLLPSRYEGFGFTPLEAMTRGCPVLASDIPPLREISGDGAMLLPLDDEEAWAHGMRRIVADASLREELRARGARTAGRYSWERTARELCTLFVRAGRR